MKKAIAKIILFVAALLPKALRYWIPRVEIATEAWFQQPSMLCKKVFQTSRRGFCRASGGPSR